MSDCVLLLEHVGEEELGARGCGLVEEGLRGGVFEEFTVVEEEDAIGDAFSKAHFVGDEEDGDAGVCEGFDGGEDFFDHFWVEGRGGLVKEDDFGVHSEGACDGDALFLTAGELMGECGFFIRKADFC